MIGYLKSFCLSAMITNFSKQCKRQDGIPQNHARDNQRSKHQEIEQLFKTKAFLLKQKSAVVTEGGAPVPVKTGNKLVVNLFRKP